MNKVKQKDLILYSGLIILGLAAPYLFSAFKVQLTYLCVLIVLAMTWNLQGGEMGYNSFGNGGVVKPCPAPIISIPPAISPAAIPKPKVQIAK